MNKTTVEKIASDTNSASPAAIADKVANVQELGRNEANAFTAATIEHLQAGSRIKGIALEELAIQFGRSANKLGRPTNSAWFALMIALSENSANHLKRDTLARKANEAHREMHGADRDGNLSDGKKLKPCATFKAKATSKGDESKASVKFNAPVSIEIEAG